MNAGCLDEGRVVAFLEGTLSNEGRAEVEAHLAACSACAELTTWAAADQAQRSRAAGEEGRPFIGQLTPGARVDRYQILGAVGRGGMGEVYAAYHPDLDRRIALKVVSESGATAPERRARLLREARAIARLSHPNVVAVYDAGHRRRSRLHRDGVRRGRDSRRVAARETARLARGPGRVHRRRARAGGRARRRHRPPRLQAPERDDRARRVGARHGLRTGAPGGRAQRSERRIGSTPILGRARRQSPRRARSSARSLTWRQNSSGARRWMPAPTSSASASRSTKRSTGAGPCSRTSRRWVAAKTFRHARPRACPAG